MKPWEETDSIEVIGAAKIFIHEANFNFLKTRRESLSWAIDQSLKRYRELLNHITLPSFTETEFYLLLSATQGVIYEPACTIDGLWRDIEDWLCCVDDEDSGADDTQSALIEKLKELTYPQEVTLIEQLEQFRKHKGDVS